MRSDSRQQQEINLATLDFAQLPNVQTLAYGLLLITFSSKFNTPLYLWKCCSNIHADAMHDVLFQQLSMYHPRLP
jgi:hypothetical protein